MTRASALVVHPEGHVRAFLSDALNLFQPGYRVATAGDLPTATRWLETLTPGLVVVGSACGDAASIDRWMVSNGIAGPTAILMRPQDGGEVHGVGSAFAATVADPVGLPELLQAIRRINARSENEKNGSRDRGRGA